MKILLKLFRSFCSIGALTFGGGYAMLPMLEKEVVEKHKWATKDELMDYFAIGQCTPGVIAVNTATFIGYKIKGIGGAIFATIGIVTPSLIIIMIIAAFLKNFAHIEWINHAFAGIRVAVVVLIIGSIIKIWKESIVDKFTLMIFIIVFITGIFLDISPVYFVITSGILGLAVKKSRGEI